ncbi:asparaginase [Gordonia phthalatica]|uniref:Asparaginase n=1 Tax=Gordonia phthalatica TaxID=1136941 RepID=A0A0N9MZZ4_9ACTN|nr:asparaginase [Gordonia phthalatica]ALG83829.1 asparaginase [Gordonia phthalatica]
MTLPHHVPLAVQTRGEIVESVHHGSLVVVNPTGGVLRRDGVQSDRFYPRSALKPLFAVGLLRAGLALTTEQLALAAASHSGAPRHQDVARSTLADAGLTADALRNAPDLPYGVAERAAWLRAGHGPTRLAQNCSGKHAALLALCVQRGWSLPDYLALDHPIARVLRDAVEDLTGETIAIASTDGCGTPVYALTLDGMARAFARLTTAAPGTPEAAVADAMRAHPELVAGEDRDVTSVMRALPGAVAKDGFEGIQLLALRDGTALALKIADGGDRARMPVAAAALADLRPDLAESLAPLFESVALGGGRPVGALRAL